MNFTPKQMAEIRTLCEEYGVRELALFGSRARGDNRPDSDYDFLIEFTPESSTGIFQFLRLREALSKTLGRHVDLVPRDALKRRVAPAALSDALRIYAH